MAACVEEGLEGLEDLERQLLNDTLSGLRSTSKGQLKYNDALGYDEDDPGTFTFSLESYFSQSPESLHSIRLLTHGNLVDLKGTGWKDETENVSSHLLQDEEVQLDGQADPSVEKTAPTVGRTIRRRSAEIAPNVESGNELTIREYHRETRGIVEETNEMRAKVFVRRAENLKAETSELLKARQTQLDEENKRFQDEMAERKQKCYAELRKKKEQLDEKAKEHKRKLDEILTKALIEESHLAEAEEKRKEVMENLKKNITSLYRQVLVNVDVIQKKCKDFPYMSFVSGEAYKGITTPLAKITTEAEEVLVKCKKITDLSVVEDHLKAMSDLVEQTMSIHNNLMIILKIAEDNAAWKKKEAEATKVKDEKIKKEQHRRVEIDGRQDLVGQRSAEKAPVDRQLTNVETNSDPTLQDGQLEEARCISNKVFSQYLKLQKVLKTTQDSFKDFSSDPKCTKYKFDLHKAVNVPINALSAHSPSHLNDKIHRLVSILSGNNVHVGGKTINCYAHPSALAFCKDLVAKKLVMQGAQQVSSSPSSAFIYAAVIVGIWSAFPDVGELILAHFHHSYPYLVPYYMPRQDGQSNNDYHKALGYSVIHDKIEDQDKFLKKFAGTVQLYAAVVTSSGANQADYPHGIEQGWTWLARVLNMKPHPSVTATMLYHFISVAGHVLMKKYGRQFQKLLLVLCKEFVPAIDKVTPPDKRGPTQRLKDFLEDCIKLQRIKVPEGYLTQRWWHSGHF